MNIKSRLTILFTLLVGSIMALFCLSIYFFYDQYREKQFYSFLNERGQTIAQLVEGGGALTTEDIVKIEKANNTLLLEDEITIYNGQDSLIFKSGPSAFMFPSATLAEVRAGQAIKTKMGNKDVIVTRHVLQNHSKPWVVVAAAQDLLGVDQLQRLREILLVGWLLSLVLVAVAGWQFAKDAIRPVSEIIEQVNRISAGNLHQKVSVGRERDELALLAETFNSMLNRLQIAFVAQKNFVSHASHELRTPLALIMTEVEVTLMKERDTNTYQEALQGILGEVKGMNELVNRLLELARTEEEAFKVTFIRIRVDEVLWQAMDFVQQKHPDYNVEIYYEDIPDNEDLLKRYGDESLLRTAFINLMDNACKYSDNKTVKVSLEVPGNGIAIRFEDHGAGMSPEELPYIFDTFYRSASTLDRSGFGIGLALTKRILMMQGVSIDVDSKLGEGTTFILHFPSF